MPPPAHILILKLGDTLPELAAELGDFEHWVAQGLHSSGLPLDITTLDPRTDTSQLPAVASLLARRSGVVLTGSHAMVTDRAPWSEATARWLADAVPQGVPVLGICYGHQLLAHALGGEVWPHPGGLEVGTVHVEPTPAAAADPLFGPWLADLEADRFLAPVAHRQSVRRLPAGATVLAHNAFEPHHAFSVGPCAWGVQFHPEFSTQATRGYVDHLSADVRTQGVCASGLMAQVAPSPQAARLLPRFARLVAERT